MLKRGLLCAACLLALAVPAGSGAAVTLLPGVTYERTVFMSSGQPVVLHVVRTPPQGELHRVRTVLSHGTVLGRHTVPGMQSRLSDRATTVGVNGDFFRLRTGASSGLFMRDGVISSPPAFRRSGLALPLDGRMVVDMFRLVGSWRAGTGPARPLQKVNRKIAAPPGIAVFTRAWGSASPKADGAAEVVLTGFPATTLGSDLVGTVAAVARGGRTPIPPGGAVLQARGTTRAALLAEATVGSVVTVRLRLANFPEGAPDAIGGGPVLVRDGVPVRRADELFTLDQIARRHPRTAVGQLADGGFLFVVADGRSSSSFGLTQWALARKMAELGAVTAVGLDGGGSSTIAFDGKVLNTPSDGWPRPVANGLFLFYYGVYAPPLGPTVLSPNGDGVDDSKVLTAKVVRPSELNLRLLRPDGSVAWSRQEVVEPGWERRVVSGTTMPEGRWRWVAEATEVGSGQTSSMQRTFRVNRTLGHLRLSRKVLRARPAAAGRLGVSVQLTRAARLDVALLGADGRVRRTLFRGQLGPGAKSWRWDGRAAGGKPVADGSYTIRVSARNVLGTVALRAEVRVLRGASS